MYSVVFYNFFLLLLHFDVTDEKLVPWSLVDLALNVFVGRQVTRLEYHLENKVRSRLCFQASLKWLERRIAQYLVKFFF